jgi:hypothetical protein
MTPANIAGATTKNSAEPRTAVIFDMRPPNWDQASEFLLHLTHDKNEKQKSESQNWTYQFQNSLVCPI